MKRPRRRLSVAGGRRKEMGSEGADRREEGGKPGDLQVQLEQPVTLMAH